MEFLEKVVLVTGGGSGIGKASALAFAAQGADIVIADMDEKGGAEVVEEIKSKEGNAVFIKTDVSQYEQVKHLIAESINIFGQIDVALNNAGIGGDGSLKTGDTTLDDWDKVIAVNQSGVFYCMKEELQHMMTRKTGVIINTASIAGLKGLANAIPYVASKHAVVGMTKTASMEYAKHGIRINALCPVFTPTKLFTPEAYGSLADAFKKRIPMKRFADVSEMADAMLWLASDKAGFVTGLSLPIDGGMSAF